MEYQKQKETPYEVLVYESLKQKILSGGYAAGEKIPEQSVSEELGVSRSPLRSAIRRLASEGLIEYYPYRGAFVKAYTDKDIHDAFAIRILLESYAISNIDPEALEQERGEIEALIACCTSGNRRDEKGARRAGPRDGHPPVPERGAAGYLPDAVYENWPVPGHFHCG